MRSLSKLTAAVVGFASVAVAGGALALASPAMAAASAGDCYTQLNAIRAQAGVPAASATALPALADAAASHASYRARTDADGATDQSQHHQSPGRPGFTGATGADRTKAAGLADGTWRGQFENVTTGPAVSGVQSWVDAPYHRIPLLDANNRAAGCSTSTARKLLGRSHAASVLELASTWDPQTKQLTTYPAAGQTDVPVSFDRLRERPAPFPAAADTVGYVTSIQADGYHALKVKSFTLTEGASHAPVAAHTAAGSRTTTATVALDTNLPANAAMLAATGSLAPHTTYQVRVAGSVQVEQDGTWTTFPTRTWSFTTAG
jgi:hypothetical protein